MIRLSLCLLIILTGAAVAHQGVKNPAVQARMHNMGLISGAMKELGNMAKGKAEFDAAKANTAVQTISIEASKTVGLFEAEEDDPKSEAKPDIWSDFTDFADKATALEEAAEAVGAISTLEDVAAALPKLGATCSACHKAYRQ